MNFTLSSLAAGLIFGVVGIWLIKTGRREGNIRLPVIGLVMLIHPYFSPNALVDWGLGCALCVVAYYNFNA